MGKRALTIVIGIVGIIVLVIVGWYVMFVHFGRGPTFPFLPVSDRVLNAQVDGLAEEQPLMAMVETEDEAEKIAEQYGIELVSFSDGVAVYQTDEKIADVIDRGREKGYPQLYMNLERTAMEAAE